MILDLISLIAGVVYIALVATALFVAGSATGTTMRRLSRAIQMYWLALAVQAVHLAVNIADISSDGPLVPVLSTATFAFAVVLLVLTYRRRAIKSEQVAAEAERTVRDWAGGAL